VKKVAEKIAGESAAVDPGRKSTFEDNAAAFNAKGDTFAGRAAAIGRAHPESKVVATEPVAKYLLDTAGLTDVTPEDFAESIEEEPDPSAAVHAEITDLVEVTETLPLGVTDHVDWMTAQVDSFGRRLLGIISVDQTARSCRSRGRSEWDHGAAVPVGSE